MVHTGNSPEQATGLAKQGLMQTCCSLRSISAWTSLVTACLSALPNTGACALALSASAARSSFVKS